MPTQVERDQVENDLAKYRDKIGEYVPPRLAGIAGTIEIRVYFHVITKSDGVGDISDKMIKHQIDVLNDAFGGVASEYIFCDDLNCIQITTQGPCIFPVELKNYNYFTVCLI